MTKSPYPKKVGTTVPCLGSIQFVANPVLYHLGIRLPAKSSASSLLVHWYRCRFFKHR